MPSHAAMYTYFRLGLVTGLVEIPEVIAWADAQLVLEPAPSADLIELSLAGRQPHSQLIYLLYHMQEGATPDYDGSLELLFERARMLLADQPDRAVEIAQGLRLLLAEARLPAAARDLVSKIDHVLWQYQNDSLTRPQLTSRLEVLLAQPNLNDPDDPMTEKLPTRLSRRVVYESKWVNLYVDRVEYPNGFIMEEHHLLDFEHHAVMAVVQAADGRWLMVNVPRYPTGRSEWEFPAGRMEDGEDPLAAARRELFEETGYRSSGHELVQSYFPMVGVSNMQHHVVRCQVEGQAGGFDRNEVSAVGWFSTDEIWGMIKLGEIMGGFTLIAFLLMSRS